MSNVRVEVKGIKTLEELKEILAFAENQETTDRYTDTTLIIDGNYARIEVEIDEYGDFVVL